MRDGTPRTRRCIRVDLSGGLHRESVIPLYKFGKWQKDNSLSQKAQFSEPSRSLGGWIVGILGCIPMKMRVGLIIVSTLLIHSAGTWAYAFFIMLQQGEVSLYERNRPLLIAEFGMAVVWTLLGIFFLGVAIRGIGRKTGVG